MREKGGKFRKEKKRKSVALKKDELGWLSKNTHFDPENIKDWHKVRQTTLSFILFLFILYIYD